MTPYCWQSVVFVYCTCKPI